MLTTPHALVGLYLITFYSPAIAIPGALVSHFLFDHFYPHWNPHIYREVKQDGKVSFNSLLVISLDMLLTAVILFWISSALVPNFWAILTVYLAALMAVLPDFITVPYFFLKVRNPYLLTFITFGHNHQSQAGPFWGAFSQVVIATIILWQLFRIY